MEAVLRSCRGGGTKLLWLARHMSFQVVLPQTIQTLHSIIVEPFAGITMYGIIETTDSFYIFWVDIRLDDGAHLGKPSTRAPARPLHSYKLVIMMDGEVLAFG